MRKSLVLIIALLFIQDIKSQDTARLRQKTRVYKTTVTILNSDHSTVGYIASISDSSIFIASSPVSISSGNNTSYPSIEYSNISKVRVARKAGAGRGILIGSIAGFLSGAIIAAASYEKPKDDVERVLSALTGGKKTEILAGGILGTLSGGAIGAIIGAFAKKTFTIGGNRNKFHEMRSKIVL